MKALRIASLLVAAFACAFPAAAQTAHITGIAHVALRVSNLESSRNFFQRLGFEEAFVFTKDEKPTQVFVKINDRQFIELYPQSDASQPLGWMHVCYETDSAEALRALYDGRGLKPGPVTKGGAGNLIFSLQDPEGSTVEITQYLPGSRHSEDRGKHLGPNRVSEALQEIKIAAPDLPVSERFYAAGLGFEKHKRAFAVSPDQRLELEPANAKPQLVFGVSDTHKTAVRLKTLGLAVMPHKRLVQVSDPDGNVLVFQQSGSASVKP